MALRANWWKWMVSGIAAAAASGVAGCGNGKEQPANGGDSKTPTVAIANSEGNTATTSDPMTPAAPPDKMHLPFEQAITEGVPSDAGVSLPPPRTLAGLNCGALNEHVQKLWNTIRFTDPDGKKQTYMLEMEVASGATPMGTIEILMRPELAPNHVRNFVALAMLHYYDGLRFDRIVRQEGMTEDGKASKLVLLEAGSPVENADPASSNLGYWLRPEFNAEAKHEEGTVGACLMPSEDNAETAAVRFYINLTPAPAMDGNFTAFGKVTHGIEVARRIAEQKVISSDPGPDQGRPATPILIRKVTVKAVPVIE